MHVATLSTFVFFTGLVGLITWLITRKQDHASSTGYSLAGRSLTFPLIAGSLLLTNLSTEQMVGLNGAAFIDGFCVMVWEHEVKTRALATPLVREPYARDDMLPGAAPECTERPPTTGVLDGPSGPVHTGA